MMDKKAIIDIAKQHNGYIYSSIISDNAIPTIYITRLVNERKLRKIYRGIYILNDCIEDPFYVYSLVYSRIVYSDQTALFLNGLSNSHLMAYHASIPYGTHVPSIDNFNFFQSRKETFSLGIEQIKTPFGNYVKCYNKERCICDLFSNRELDFEDRNYAINEYKSNYLNLKKLYEYAKQLGVYDKVSIVFEVIGWK